MSCGALDLYMMWSRFVCGAANLQMIYFKPRDNQARVIPGSVGKHCACWLFQWVGDNVFAPGCKSFSMKECVKTNSQFMFFIYSDYLSLALFCICPLISLCLCESQKRAEMLHIVRVYIFHVIFFLFSFIFNFFRCVSQSRLSHDCLLWESTVNLLFL